MRTRVFLLALAAAAGADAAPEWTVRPDGAGPLKVGMDFDTVNRVLGDHLVRTPAALQPTQGCFYVSPAAEPRVGLMFVDDVLKRVDVSEVGVRSDRGVGVGDPVDKVSSAYGQAVRTSPQAYDDRERFLTVQNGQYAIRFATRQGTVAGFYAGAWEQVQYDEGCL